jgi:hypothetical protein
LSARAAVQGLWRAGAGGVKQLIEKAIGGSLLQLDLEVAMRDYRISAMMVWPEAQKAP